MAAGHFAKPEKLFQVMPSVHHVKRSPLRRRERAHDRMVEQLDVPPEAGFTLRNDRIHRRELCPDLVLYLRRR